MNSTRDLFIELSLVLSLILIIGCSSSSNDEDAEVTLPLAPTFLFAITHDNTAPFNSIHNNVIIEVGGEVYLSTDNPNIDGILVDGETYPATEIIERFKYQPSMINQAEGDFLWSLYESLSDVDPNRLGQPTSECADFGRTRFWGFIFNSGTNQYQAILLEEFGDQKQVNDSPEAIIIVDWLEQVAATAPFDFESCR